MLLNTNSFYIMFVPENKKGRLIIKDKSQVSSAVKDFESKTSY